MAEHVNWKKLTKVDSPYLGEWDVAGNDVIATIIDAKLEEVKIPARGIVKNALVITFKEFEKKFVCNQTNASRIEKALGTKYIDEWIGKKIQLYSDPNVKFASQTTAAIRVRTFAPKSEKVEYHCSVCGTIIDENTYKQSVAKYGKAYCSKNCLDIDKNGTDLL